MFVDISMHLVQRKESRRKENTVKKMQSKYKLRVGNCDIKSPHKILPDIFDFFL